MFAGVKIVTVLECVVFGSKRWDQCKAKDIDHYQSFETDI